MKRLSALALLLLSCLAQADDMVLRVAAPYLDLRTGPGRGYPVTAVIESGESLQVHKMRTDWIKVTSQGRRQYTGWVHRAELLDANDERVAQLVVPQNSVASNRARRFSWQLGSGSFNSATLLTTTLAWRLSPNLDVAFSAGQAFSDVANTSLYTASIRHSLFPHWRLSPFVELGTGQLSSDPQVTLSESAANDYQVFLAGGGVDYFLTRNFFVSATFRQYQALTDRNQNQEIQSWQLGLTATF